MRKEKPIILFDMDSTLCNYTKGLADGFNKVRHCSEPIYTEHHFDVTLPEPEWMADRRKFITSQGEFWVNLEPLDSGFFILNQATFLGFRPIICTKAPFDKSEAWAGKHEWCRKNLPPNVSIVQTEDKSVVYGRVLVDDYPEYVAPWLKVRTRGVVIMPAYKWNIEFKHPRCFRFVYRRSFDKKNVKHQTELVNILKTAYNRK